MRTWIEDIVFNRGEQYLVVADALERAVRNGLLGRGARLPTQRALAQRLGVSVSTISRAYLEVARRGLVSSTVGRGTFVSDSVPETPADLAAEPDPRRLDSLYIPLMQGRELINMSLNYPLAEETAGLLEAAMDGLARSGTLTQFTTYETANGSPAHRAAGQRWLAHYGLEAPLDDILVIPGGQGGLTAIFLALCRPGDVVLTEELTWPGVMALAATLGIRLLPVAMDGEGLRPDAFEAACRTGRPKLIYTMPTLHNPRCVTAGEGRRRAIARIARAHDVVIVEDDAYGFLAPDAPPAYAALARDITIHFTSLSKPVAPALRIGYAVAPRRFARALLSALRATMVMVSPIIGELATRMILAGTAMAAAAHQARQAERRQGLAARHLGGYGLVSATGLHCWLPLPPGWRTADFTAQALASGVAVTPGDAFAAASGFDPLGVRICLCAVPEERQLEAGLGILAGLLRSQAEARLPVI